MGISYSTAKWLAPLSFAVDFAAQNYGMLSTPNMKDIHDKNISYWSPQPFFIAGFFFPQQLFQLGWLYRLYKLDPARPNEKAELDRLVDFVPYYSIGNFCIAAWMVFWNSNRLDISHAFVTVNTATQLFYIFAKKPKMNTSSTSSVLTHIVSTTFAGIGVLDFLHNYSAAFHVGEAPSPVIKAVTGAVFGGLALASDWVFGSCLVYDLVALAVGQSGDWRNLLSVFAVGTAGIVAARNIARPPYTSGYALVPDEAL